MMRVLFSPDAAAGAAVATPPAQGTPTPVVEPVKVVAPPAAVPPKTEAVPPKAEEKPNSLLSEPPDPSKPAPVVAAKADYSKLKLPDGSLLKPEAVEAVKAFGEKHGLTAEAAQAVLEEKAQTTKAYHESLLAGRNQQIEAWKNTVKAHPVFGGPNLQATDQAISGVVSRYGPKGLMEEIQANGLNWHPGFLEFLHNVANATKDSKFVQGGPKVSQVKYGNLESLY